MLSPTCRIVTRLLLLPALFALAACQDSMTDPDRGTAAPQFAKGGSGLPFSELMAELGDEIFDDEDLSINRNQSCKSCHEAEWGFTGPHSDVNAGGAVYEGSIAGRLGDRKPPSSAYSTPAPLLALTRQAGGMFVGGNFWDGRATGWVLGNPAADQAQGPFTNPAEQALRDPACVVYRVSVADYGDLYRQLWGNGIDAIVFPADLDAQCALEGAPFDLDPATRAAVDVEYANIAIAIAVYEESHGLFTSRFDAARKGLYKFTQEEQRGLALFQGKGKCSKCHTSSGQDPLFTDFTYDNLGVPKNPANPATIANPDWADPGLGGFLLHTDWAPYAAGEWGKMKVPSLRNVDMRPHEGDIKAYMHNGVFKSLEEVVRFYNTRDVLPPCAEGAPRSAWGDSCWPAPEVPQNVNTSELGNLGLTAAEEAAIVAFLRTLSDGFMPGTRGKHFC
jgi:cytochrome c peroxidase